MGGVPGAMSNAAGTLVAGATRPSTDWFLAEGATGSFFTTFVLVSNPNATPAAVTMMPSNGPCSGRP